MINIEIISNSKGIRKAIDELFVKRKNSKIKFVRLATHYNEFETASKICKLLKQKGYSVCINIMQISEYSEKEIALIAKKIKKINPNVFYFADSLGSLETNQVRRIVKSIKSEWNGEIGIHAHDNLSKAISNTVEAINLGVNWVDSTVTGMGRGTRKCPD